jgi:aldehyde decarbonylase
MHDPLGFAVRLGNQDKVDCVYLTHATDILSVFHQSFGFQTFAAQPYSKKWYMWLTWPAGFLIMVASWLFAKPFTATTHLIGKSFELQTWIIPRYNFQVAISHDAHDT